MSCECRTGNFHIHFSITSEGALQFSLWDAFYWAYLHFGRCVKGGKKNALKKKDLGWKMRRGSIHLNSKPGDGLRTSLMSRNKAILHIACCVIVGLVFTFV